MDDKDIKDLFSRFDPELSSDSLFMNDLVRQMDAVEMVVDRNRVMYSRRKKATVIAGVTGFVVGALCSLLILLTVGPADSQAAPVSTDTLLSLLSSAGPLVMWAVTAAAAVFTAVNAYNIALSLMSRRDSKPAFQEI